MSTPAKPYPVVILGLPRSMTYWTAKTLGYDHDVSQWPVATPAPGLCDTGLYLHPPEVQSRHIGPETKVIILRRPVRDCHASLMRHFPQLDSELLAGALLKSLVALCRFGETRDALHLPMPFTPATLATLARHLRREAELPAWIAALATKEDRLADPLIRAEIGALVSNL